MNPDYSIRYAATWNKGVITTDRQNIQTAKHVTRQEKPASTETGILIRVHHIAIAQLLPRITSLCMTVFAELTRTMDGFAELAGRAEIVQAEIVFYLSPPAGRVVAQIHHEDAGAEVGELAAFGGPVI